MSQNVTRLKELLFESEALAISELSKKIDSVAETDNRGREELRRKVDEVFNRAGTIERFTNSVSETLDEALRKAEISKHEELTRSIAPLVVTTIKTELRNSQDEMVEALYPITGRLVKAYVASAIKDLNAQMNRRIEQNPIMLRLQSLTTGRSVAELALAGSQNFELEELFLIRRGTGELVAHWPDDGKSGREQLMSGVLAAVNEVANEAFAADQSSMREIDLGDANVYLRGSPLYLLAARCTGTAPAGIDQVLDTAFLSAIERQNEIADLPAEQAEAAQAETLNGMGKELLQRIAEQKEALSRPSGNPLKAIALAILLPLIAWIGWNFYNDYTNSRTREVAQEVVAGTADMQGYPARFFASERGKALTVSGLVPSQDVKQKVLQRLAVVLPNTSIRDELAIVPGSDVQVPDVEPAINAIRRSVTGLEGELSNLAVERAAARTERSLRQAENDLRQAAKSAEDQSNVQSLAQSADDVAALLKSLAANRPVFTGGDEAKAATSLTTTAQGIANASAQISVRAGGAKTTPVAFAQSQAKGKFPLDLPSETMAAEAERLAAVASTAALAGTLRPKAAAVPTQSPRAILEEWCRGHAIFFGNNAEYRDDTLSARTLDALAELLMQSKLPVRIVGYTDETGGLQRNVPLAQERAERVRQELITRGVSASLLHAVGRADARDLSTSQGVYSANRRVEFEVAFEGELTP